MTRNAYATGTAKPTLAAWSTRTLVSVSMAGFLALMGSLSIPLPWTPVPFSMMPFALLVAGGVQRPGYAAASVVMYLVAAGLGAPILADGESGWTWFVGSSAGYLLGFVACAVFVSWAIRRPTGPSPRALTTLTVLTSLATFAGIATIAWMWTWGGSGLESDWGVGASTAWVLAFVVPVLLGFAAWRLRDHGGTSAAASFFTLLAGILLIHAFGVPVLWLATDLTLIEAIALGSVVFLPFDIVKAGLAVAAILPFRPSPPTPSPTDPSEPLHA